MLVSKVPTPVSPRACGGDGTVYTGGLRVEVLQTGVRLCDPPKQKEPRQRETRGTEEPPAAPPRAAAEVTHVTAKNTRQPQG